MDVVIDENGQVLHAGTLKPVICSTCGKGFTEEEFFNRCDEPNSSCVWHADCCPVCSVKKRRKAMATNKGRGPNQPTSQAGSDWMLWIIPGMIFIGGFLMWLKDSGLIF